jgi:hypothetical protein
MGRAPEGVRVPELFFDAAGAWFVDGERIAHARTLSVLSANARLDDDGTWVTSIGRETAPFTFADVPLFVCEADVDSGILQLRLSNGAPELQTVAEFRRGTGSYDNALYVRILAGRAWARFTRAAYQAILPHWQADGDALVLALRDGPARFS